MHWIQIIYSLDTLQDQYFFFWFKRNQDSREKEKKESKEAKWSKNKEQKWKYKTNQLQVSSQFA